MRSPVRACVANVDAAVRDLYLRAGHHPAAPPGPARLATGLLGSGCLGYTTSSALSPGQPMVLIEAGAWRILSRPDTRDELLALSIVRGLARWARLTGAVHCRIDPAELALRLLLPAEALLITRGICGYSAHEIARMFVADVPLVRLRLRDLGETGHSGEYKRA